MTSKTTSFESLPPELRNKIYRHLFSLQDAQVERSYCDYFSKYKAYVFPVAILRTSWLVYQEAHAVLYSDNLLVLLDLHTSYYTVEELFEFAEGASINIINSEAPMPPASVHIRHEIEDYSFHRTRIVIAAADIDLVCHALQEKRRDVKMFICYIFTVLKVPQHGWTSEKLSECIWKPLRNCLFRERDQVIDRTGVFETRLDVPATEGPSGVETDGKGNAKEDADEGGDGDGDGDGNGGEDRDEDAEENGDEDGE